MSYEIEYTGKIKKDIKLAQKRGLDLELFKEVVILLEKNGKLPTKYKPHILKGNFKGYWECHIQPDWLLIWKQDEEIKLVSLTRTGTHSDLFK
ncbi:type II toxin-antitoxin system YafQ family toxin [Epilithonimonas ginsengisoli]|uniref:Type II toxin-antitoxin system YafQ family toxin n=1 Tax=Epilithonimonas ginsengisoli TaxID=1245592 RepID=A0ABU4JMR4_9FLAO|nr:MULTISPECIES: type II toxin-antitoxin system YafQ family toxin [Chryseobacterium group]MBV6881736.1 type II toxin-antitoxin system YafQ family toxin [Epilithonimonas sp. FP105]MDW8550786.1 type II toxin-antitoxin system YafQ family toxin [Epilithonimonas ginsengisoli]OAH68192.1 addiction module toxin RelE [Chryseobacterium sp. FP211-J200]